jgi:hypothetical protein
MIISTWTFPPMIAAGQDPLISKTSISGEIVSAERVLDKWPMIAGQSRKFDPG